VFEERQNRPPFDPSEILKESKPSGQDNPDEAEHRRRAQRRIKAALSLGVCTLAEVPVAIITFAFNDFRASGVAAVLAVVTTVYGGEVYALSRAELAAAGPRGIDEPY
jgi:hypothetical protein